MFTAWNEVSMRDFMHPPDTEKGIENNFAEEIKENQL